MTQLSRPGTGRVRMSPESRREQLIEHGVRLLSTRPLDEVSIEVLAEEELACCQPPVTAA